MVILVANLVEICCRWSFASVWCQDCMEKKPRYLRPNVGGLCLILCCLLSLLEKICIGGRESCSLMIGLPFFVKIPLD